MRERRPMLAWWIAGGVLFALTATSPGQDAGPAAGQQPPGVQGKAPPGGQGKQQAAKPARQGREPNKTRRPAARQAERRQAGVHLSAAFPRTNALLAYLQHNDPAAHEALLRHSAQLTERRKTAALRLAKEHVPELFQLIQQARERFPRAYDTAMRELVEDHARILRAMAIDKETHDAALNEWKWRSRIRLLAARMTVENQPEMQKRLERALIQSERAKRRQIRRQIQRQQEQIQRQQEQIQRLQRRLAQDPTVQVQKQLQAINKRVQPRAGNAGKDNSNKRRRQ